MSLLVMKFGGTSVGDTERIKIVAHKVQAEVKRGHKVAVVVSAMAGVTDQLLGYCRAIAAHPDPREQDAVAATGEQVTASLTALALQELGIRARSWQGWLLPRRRAVQCLGARESRPWRSLERNRAADYV